MPRKNLIRKIPRRATPEDFAHVKAHFREGPHYLASVLGLTVGQVREVTRKLGLRGMSDFFRKNRAAVIRTVYVSRAPLRQSA